MRPYPGKNLSEAKAVFNYRLSRARRIIENSFGILAARWRIFRRPILAEPEHVIRYTQATIALHNFLRTTESSVYCPPGFTDGEDGGGNVLEGTWRNELHGDQGLTRLCQIGGNSYRRSAAGTRELFQDYFLTPEGEVSWQYNFVHRTS
jgi:hypothetical protein